MTNALLIGKPNTGKSLLFNKLASGKQKVTNFPGVTVEVKSGASKNIRYYDYPGIYSLDPITTDEELGVEKFIEGLKQKNAVVVCVLDATRLERSLVVGLQARELARKNNRRFIFALNMIDEIKKADVKINLKELEESLKTEIVPISAKTGENLEKLKETIKDETSGELKEKLPEDKKELSNLCKKITKMFLSNPSMLIKKQNNLDRVFLSTFWGSLIFIGTMLILFQSIFTWSAPLMDAIENLITNAGSSVSSLFQNQILSDFIEDAIFGGCGSFLVFVPQIFVLGFVISFLEDSGYLARASIFCHKVFSFFGLSGRSFIPYLSAHACAIPAILASRTITSPKRRFLTMLTIPLIACSARLPVYALFIAVLIPDYSIFGIIGLRGLVFAALFAFGILTALIVSIILSNTIAKKQSDMPFIIELPPYRWPNLKTLILKGSQQAWLFVANAGFIIFSVTVVVWTLGYFPDGQGNLSSSFLAKISNLIEPIVEPIGLDWKFGVAILSSFLAREVFVGTLATLYGLESVSDQILGLSEHLSGISLASGVSLLVFYAIALQCVSTLAVLKKELGSYKIPILLFVFYTVLAYLLMLISYYLINL